MFLQQGQVKQKRITLTGNFMLGAEKGNFSNFESKRSKIPQLKIKAVTHLFPCIT